jgi:hypothetical protein
MAVLFKRFLSKTAANGAEDVWKNLITRFKLLLVISRLRLFVT